MKPEGIKSLAAQVNAREARALGKAITSLSNNDPDGWALLSQLDSRTESRVFGITGPPGAGKSTLIGTGIQWLRAQGKTVAVVAVDPVSPFTGGSVLGDRIRLKDHFNDAGVFIRSLSTRGKLGGLAASTSAIVDLLRAAQFDWIFLETVGVGQSEVDIRRVADLTAVVITPEWGDTVQALKAGILEISDVFLVNKAEREGVERVLGDIKGLLEISQRTHVPVLTASNQKPASYGDLWQQVDALFSKSAKEIEKRRRDQAKYTLQELISSILSDEVEEWLIGQAGSAANPYEAALKFLAGHKKGSLFKK